jgi:hypothetical protein
MSHIVNLGSTPTRTESSCTVAQRKIAEMTDSLLSRPKIVTLLAEKIMQWYLAIKGPESDRIPIERSVNSASNLLHPPSKSHSVRWLSGTESEGEDVIVVDGMRYKIPSSDSEEISNVVFSQSPPDLVCLFKPNDNLYPW